MTGRTIIAIDPGNVESAYVVMRDSDGIIEKGKIDNDSMLQKVYEFHEFYPDCELYIEMVASYGMAVGKSVFDTVFWIGRFFQAYYKEPKLIYRKDVKMHHCNSMRAKDGNIRQALIDKYGEPGTKKAQGFTYGVSKDIWSALAIATYIFESNK